MSSKASPHHLFDTIYRFKPNRATGGGSSYLIVHPQGNVLLDAPAWNEEHVQAIQEMGGVAWWIFTHRGGIGEVERWLTAIVPQIVVHEQEAFLINGPVTRAFRQDTDLLPDVKLIWTPGHSPGSICVLYQGTLFTGRHLLPDSTGLPRPLRLAKTFHWPRQLNSVRKLLEGPQFTRICPGAAVGLLRTAPAIEDAWEKVQAVYKSDNPRSA
ncbi:MBL fold metallo-hydrolase [Anthocerotibacter panamensis]|uniref:hypothetical protein n=1 Tax=Anthocerotibacter panamensis TaxID=2857077 RepID=UPI001C40609A|nr:hypothetical protein [Anthocerotibacter panamensis]